MLALESVDKDDERLGTVVMGTTAAESSFEPRGADPTGVARELGRASWSAGSSAPSSGAIVIGAGALALGASGGEVVGVAAAGAMLVAVFGIMWVMFAGMDGSDAHRQIFVDDDVSRLTLVSVHTDDADEAAAAHDRLRKAKIPIIDVDRFGRVSGL